MQKLLERWLPAAGGVVCVILLGLNVQLMFGNMRTLQEDFGWVAHTREVIAGLDNVLSLLKDAKTGQRGDLLTGMRAPSSPATTPSLPSTTR